MGDRLILKRVYPDSEIYATLYEHPNFGRIDVGYVAKRRGNPTGSDDWEWGVRITTLPSPGLRGTAPTMKQALAEWKKVWPSFRDRITDDVWFDVKQDQDRKRGKWK